MSIKEAESKCERPWNNKLVLKRQNPSMRDHGITNEYQRARIQV